MIIIGVAGKAGAGKTLFANFLVEHYLELTNLKRGCQILPFAQALKEMALGLGWNGEKDAKGRRLLQLLGTEICRECISQNYWVAEWEAARQKAKGREIKLIVADDVRFSNEVEHILNLGGIMYQLHGRASNIGAEALKHKSEEGLVITEDFQINNNSTRQALSLQALTIIKELIHWVP